VAAALYFWECLSEDLDTSINGRAIADSGIF